MNNDDWERQCDAVRQLGEQIKQNEPNEYVYRRKYCERHKALEAEKEKHRQRNR